VNEKVTGFFRILLEERKALLFRFALEFNADFFYSHTARVFGNGNTKQPEIVKRKTSRSAGHFFSASQSALI